MNLHPDELLICRSKHICSLGEGDRSFKKAFKERFLVRDITMLDDHNCFMTFDINSEKEARSNLEKFAKYVI